jgi:hypothetical protein
MSKHIATDTPLEITTFGYIADGEVERVYYVVKQRDRDLFLKHTMKATAVSSWTPNLKKTALFYDPEKLRVAMSRIFESVIVDK